MIEVKIYRVNPSIELPKFATEGSACFDLRYYAEDGKDFVLEPGKTHFVPTGLFFDLPPNTVMHVFCRSGLGSKGIMLGNGVGVIDWDYVGEVNGILYNSTDKPYTIKPNERIMQAYVKYLEPTMIRPTEIKPTQKTSRSGGYGSTGKN